MFLRRGHELLVPEAIKPWFDATEKSGNVILRERRLGNEEKNIQEKKKKKNQHKPEVMETKTQKHSVIQGQKNVYLQ